MSFNSKTFPPLPREDLDHVLTLTRGLWEDARNKRFFITGGTGFFGIWLLETFAYINRELQLNAEAYVLTRNPDRFTDKIPHLRSVPGLHFLKGDVRNFEFPEGDFDYLIHAATETGSRLNQDSPHEMLDSIVGGMKRVLDFSAAKNVSKMLFTSSGAVYGSQPHEITHVGESYLGGPDCLNRYSAYGEGKRVAELMAMLHGELRGYEVKIARCFAFVGPHLPLDAQFAVGNFIGNVINREVIRINGDGTPRRSYLYASDLAIWLWTLLFKGKHGQAYNVGSDEDVSIRELAALVDRLLEGNGYEVKLPESGKPAARYVPSIAKAKDDLGLVPHITLEEGVGKTWKWLNSFR